MEQRPMLPKERAHYRAASAHRMWRRCETCSMFRWKTEAAGTCTLVIGSIDPRKTCDYWEPDPLIGAKALAFAH